MERFCEVGDLRPALRQTFLLIDENALARADDPAAFAANNASLRDVASGFSDPGAATSSGTMDHRERLSIFLMPADGSAARLLFEGCLPSLSPEEIAAAESGNPAVSSFFTGGVRQQLMNEGEQFRSRAIGALLRAARAAPGAASPETERLIDSRLVRSLRASGHFINGESGLPRVVLLSNLAHTNFGEVRTINAVRRRGFEEGASSALDLGGAELHVFLAEGPDSELAREYAQAFFLAQRANLLGWADAEFSAMPAPPISVTRYAGEAAGTQGRQLVEMRIALDRQDRLVNSWLVLLGRPDHWTPLTGARTCDVTGSCRLRSDDSGFAQLWSSSPGGQPEFDNEMPFGGLREWEVTLQDALMTGRVFDRAVRRISSAPGGDSIALTGRLVSESVNLSDGRQVVFCEEIGRRITFDQCRDLSRLAARAEAGVAAFNAPNPMQRGQAHTLQLAISDAPSEEENRAREDRRNASSERRAPEEAQQGTQEQSPVVDDRRSAEVQEPLQRPLPQTPEEAVEPLQGETVEYAPLVGRFMRAELKGSGFEITSLSPPSQEILPDSVTTWNWRVVAQEGGRRSLTLTTVVEGCNEEGQCYPLRSTSYNHEVSVTVGWLGQMSDLFTALPIWLRLLAGVLSALAALVAAWFTLKNAFKNGSRSA